MPILSLFLVIIAGCTFSYNESDPQLEQKFFDAVKVSIAMSLDVDLTEKLNNKFYDIVRENKNPLSLSFGQRVNLFLACSRLLYEDKEANVDVIYGEMYNTYKNKGELPFKASEMVEVGEGFFAGSAPSEREAKTGEAINKIREYNNLLCLNGFPVYKNRIKQMVNDVIFNPERITFKERDKLVGFTELFPEGYVYYQGSVEVDEIPCEGTTMGSVNWYGSQITVCSYDTEAALDLCEYNNPEVDPIHGKTICPIIFYNAVITKYRKGIDDDSLILTGVRQNVQPVEFKEAEIKTTATYEERLEEYKQVAQPNQQEQSIIEAKQKIIETKTYDFPEIKVNKQDIYYSFNYDTTLTKIFSPYKKIGLNVDGREYVFLLQDGKITDIREESTNGSDFVLTTSVNEIKELIEKGKEGDIEFIVKKVVTMKIPLKVKAQLMKNYIKNYIG